MHILNCAVQQDSILQTGGCVKQSSSTLSILGYSYSTRPAVSSPRAECGPIEGFVRPSLGCYCGKSILYSDNLSLFR